MSVATITSKGQLTLPKEVREQLHVGQGDKLEFLLQPDGTMRVQRLGGSALRLYGMMRRPGMKPPTLAEIDEDIARYLAEEDERIQRQRPREVPAVSETSYPGGRLHGVDTNVLVRYYAGDDAERSPLARALVARAEQRGENLFVSLPVLCELVWTFAGARYRAGREQLVDLVTGLLDSPVFEVQERSLVRQALEDFRYGGADFADYLIGRCCEAAGCAATFTFDAELATSPGFRRPGADSTP